MIAYLPHNTQMWFQNPRYILKLHLCAKLSMYDPIQNISSFTYFIYDIDGCDIYRTTVFRWFNCKASPPSRIQNKEFHGPNELQ